MGKWVEDPKEPLKASNTRGNTLRVSGSITILFHEDEKYFPKNSTEIQKSAESRKPAPQTNSKSQNCSW